MRGKAMMVVRASVFVVLCVACSTPERVRPQQVEERIAVDGTADFRASVADARAAAVAALRGAGHTLDDAASTENTLVTQKQKTTVERWRWMAQRDPTAARAADTGAWVGRAAANSGAAGPIARQPGDDIPIEWRMTLALDVVEEGVVQVSITPQAYEDSADVTDDWLAVDGLDAARHRYENIFDAMRETLSSTAVAP